MPDSRDAPHSVEPTIDVLPNGLRVVATAIPHSQAAVLAAYVGVGSRDEARETLGLSHYLEHMLFKGTESRPEPTAISAAIEGAGGSLNAFTSRELTCYWNRVPFDRLTLAMDVLADSVRHSLLAESEIERERTVICSEIRRAHDQPGQRVSQLMTQATYGEQPLGWEIAGDLESVGAVTREHLAEHIETFYRPSNIVLSVAGNVEPEEVVELAERHWGDGWSERAADETPARSAARDAMSDESAQVEVRDLEQCSLALALRSIHRLDPDRYAMTLLNEVLGGGMSSRLFTEIREKRGLAYSVGSHPTAFADAGHLSIMAGVTADHVLETVDVALDELRKLTSEPVEEEELERVREHAVGSFRLGLDAAASWCHRAGGMLLANGFIEPVEETIAGYESVTTADIQRVARRVIREGNLAAAVVGPFDQADDLRERVDRFSPN
ncbi:MAG: insulinase family protein [Chloroflexi bacterium]|nr:insulinase family protein [Chloroflexota bacterium]MYD17984.1 insulinase family protein [Chloroflexota bacterium]